MYLYTVFKLLKAVAKLVEITEKRTHRIPSCKVDKELLLDIGNLIDNSKRSGENVHYSLKAKSRDIRSQNLKEFAAEPPKDAEEIRIRLSKPWSTSIDVRFNLDEGFLTSDHGEVSVSDPDATWVHGVADRLNVCFEKKKLGYRAISERGELRAIISISLTVFLFVSFGYVFLTLSSLDLETIATTLALAAMISGIFLDIGLKRLFPYFELESRPLPRKARKWIIGILIGSGLLPTIILKIFGL